MKKSQIGFTLIELMITLSVISILSMIAYPSYQEYIKKSRRLDAKNSLLDLASRQQKYFSINNKFSLNANDLGYSSLPADIASSNGSSFYKLSIASTDGGKTWTATATAQGNQSSDKCGNFSITDKGVQSFSATTGTKNNCW